jgi:tight adherence protein B
LTPKVAAALAAFGLMLPAGAKAAPVHLLGVDTGDYPELRVTVVAPAGSRQPGLRENGVPVTGLDAINLGQAKSVALLVDRSESMKGAKLHDAIAAARQFIAAKSPNDRVMVIAFGHNVLPLAGFSNSGGDADAALANLTPDTTSGTALWDAVVAASKKLGHEDQRGHVIIVLTDGQDVSSTATFNTAAAVANRADVSIYPIGITGRDYTPGPLRDLAGATGGTYYEASSSSDLTAVYSSIGRTLSHAWELRYLTAARPGDVIKLTSIVPGGGLASESVRLAGISGSQAVASPGVLPTSFWLSPAAPVIVSLLVGGLVLLAAGFVFAARHGLWVRARLQPHIGQPSKSRSARRKHPQRTLRQTLVLATDRALKNLRQFRSIERLIERADLPLRASELIYISIGSGAILGFFGAVTIGSMLPVLIFVAAGAVAPFLYVRFKASGRLKAFDNQLPDLLITMSASLKAGHSFRHSIQAVVDEGAQPSAKEFTRVLSETQLGRGIDEALGDMAERVGSKNLEFVVTAVTIQRQVGGSLAGLFDMVAETVRQRQQFVRKVRGLTAMGRMSAYILIALPIFIAIAITLLNPEYMAPLYSTSAGHALLIIGTVMMTVGSAMLKKMVAFKG